MSQLAYSETSEKSDNTQILDLIVSQYIAGKKSGTVFNRLIRDWTVALKKDNTSINKQQIKASINWVINSIDELINENINSIIHHEKFQKLEAGWRGIEYLVNESAYNKRVKIKLFNISWKEVSKDISKAIEFDQSTLFTKIYSEEYGLPGGEPYGVILGDYEISHLPNKDHPYDDMATLEGITAICAAAFSPFVAAASADLFGLDHFTELTSSIKFEQSFKNIEYLKWKRLRQRPDSRFVGLTLPHYLSRKPYTNKLLGKQKILFNETLSDNNAKNYLWGNACYVFGAILIREFINVGWFGHIRGVPRGLKSGGLVTNLNHDSHKTDSEGIAVKLNTDVLITDSLERRLSDLGFMPLCQCYNTVYSAFYSNQSIQSLSENGSNSHDINSKLSTMLQHIFCGSRIAHYLKVMIRDKVGSFITADECERYLQDWLHRYTTGREDLEWDEQARYPLREANVSVREKPSSPGKFLCVIYLKPHYQLDNMVSELELVTELSSTYSSR